MKYVKIRSKDKFKKINLSQWKWGTFKLVDLFGMPEPDEKNLVIGSSISLKIGNLIQKMISKDFSEYNSPNCSQTEQNHEIWQDIKKGKENERIR